MNDEPLDYLELADPDISKSLKSIIIDQHIFIDLNNRQTIVDVILWAMSIEIDLGYAVFKGIESILLSQQIDSLTQYFEKTKYYATFGTSSGILVAEILPMVLLCQKNTLIKQFYQTLDKLLDIGIYILHRPLKSFGRILLSNDSDGALQTLRLFEKSFTRQLDFHQSKKLTQFLPQLCECMPPAKRAFQLKQLILLANKEIEWLYACEIGLKNGLQSLNQKAFSEFIQKGIQKYSHDPEKGYSYFSIESELSKNIYETLQTSVFFHTISHQLIQYLHARIGSHVHLRPLSQVRHLPVKSKKYVLSNCHCIYLPDEIERYPRKQDNLRLYKNLLRWEASHLEWGTYDFDLEKYTDHYSDMDNSFFKSKGSDLNRFFSYFSNQFLAEDLFTVFEHSRIRLCLFRNYPGILKKILPVFQEWIISKGLDQSLSPIQQLYNILALDMKILDHNMINISIILQNALKMLGDKKSTVETSARLVWKYYPDLSQIYNNKQSYVSISTPFHRRIYLDFSDDITEKWHQLAQHIYKILKQQHIKVYLSDVKKKLRHHQGQLSVGDLQQIIVNKDRNEEVNDRRLTRLMSQNSNIDILPEIIATGAVFKYNEWDSELGSYRLDYTRVIQQDISIEPNQKYDVSLVMYSGLLRHIRRRFEMLRPEGLKMLRRWREGDDFDYRQLLEYGIDRKMHKTPSDRLYTKRVKEYRDVAVFLLIDLSRSTANFALNANRSVMEIEQDAIILFCEALKQCGDPFAIAGFSGNGRHRVNFYLIKSLEEGLTNEVKNKIGNILPYRSTRVGAAIRHATALFKKAAAKIRLLIVLSDGFPNDTGYKDQYAVKDTRKSIHEARCKGVYVHGITVNLSSNAKLDDLYGKGNHHVISDVTDLPDRLPGIYHYLTKT